MRGAFTSSTSRGATVSCSSVGLVSIAALPALMEESTSCGLSLESALMYYASDIPRPPYTTSTAADGLGIHGAHDTCSVNPFSRSARCHASATSGQPLVAIDTAKQLGSHYVVTKRHAQLQAGLDFIGGACQHAMTTRGGHPEQRHNESVLWWRRRRRRGRSRAGRRDGRTTRSMTFYAGRSVGSVPTDLASLTIPCWNQIAGFLESMRQLRDSAGFAA